MKIIHTSDIHIGMENYGRVDPATGMSSRLVDFLETFDEVVNHAIASRADLFLFTGDAFKTRDPNPTQQREFARRIARLRAEGIAVFLLVGNHDLPNAAGKATSLDIYHALSLQGVTVGTRAELHGIETRSGPVQIISLPWVLRSGFLARDDYKNRTLADLNTLLLERVEGLISDLAEQLDPALPALLAAHGTVFGASLGAERNIMLGQDLVLHRSIITNPRFQYVALGHIHRHQVLSNRPLAIYPGSLQRIDFGEEAEEKGFLVVEIERNRDPEGEPADRWTVGYEFLPVDARTFLTIRVDADRDDPTEAVVEAIERAEIAEKVVRVQIKVSEQREGMIREADVRRALKDAYFVAGINKDVVRTTRPRLGGRMAGELTPTQVLEEYFKAKQTPGDRRAVLMERAQELMHSG